MHFVLFLSDACEMSIYFVERVMYARAGLPRYGGMHL